MTAVYAVVLIAGFLGLLAWVAMAAIADTVDGWDHVDPESRFGARGRYGVAAAMGLGLAGMSATFAGWPAPAAAVGAVAGAGFLVVIAARYGPEDRWKPGR